MCVYKMHLWVLYVEFSIAQLLIKYININNNNNKKGRFTLTACLDIGYNNDKKTYRESRY